MLLLVIVNRPPRRVRRVRASRVPAESLACAGLVEGGYPGRGNVDADPLFVDPLQRDYRLASGSPCIDTGHPWGAVRDIGDADRDGDIWELAPLDHGGAPRFADDPSTPDASCGHAVVSDIGAYEFQGIAAPNALFGDINQNGVVGIDDLIEIVTAWGDCGSESCCLADLDFSRHVSRRDDYRLMNIFARVR